MKSFLDILFPKSCSICKRKGTYLCDRCKKLFKRSIPECYICRRISNDYQTHNSCKSKNSLNSIYIAWEYNSLSSDLLKKYKYGYAYDISSTLSDFFIETVLNSTYRKLLINSLIINVPISSNRLHERGFNQTYDIAKKVAEEFSIEFNDSLMIRKSTSEHQSLKDKTERDSISKNDFLSLKEPNISKYRSITIVDDVVTTGATLEAITDVLRDKYGEKLAVNALCMFRGRPFYSSTDSGVP
jgi:ComF family protein